MKVLALEFYNNGFMTEAFAFGGSAEKESIDQSKKYESSLQNYLIDTGKEVILVDTGVPVETPEVDPQPGQMIYQGKKVNNFVDALKKLGYEPKDVDKVIVTHKHPDHTGELRLFNHAKIYISEIEADAMKLDGDNIVRVKFESGPYKNFKQSERISENLVMLPAHGHTKGNSIAVLELDGLNYMFHGDVTYTDEALRRNELSVVFEDKDLARETLENVREFVKENDTVYLSTHTTEALVSLKEKKIMKL